MYDVILNLVIGVSSNALFGLISSRTVGKAQRSAVCEAMSERARAVPHINALARKAAGAIAQSSRLRNENDANRLKSFLASPEVEAVARQVFATSTLTEQSARLDDVRIEFQESLQLFLGYASPELEIIGSSLFDTIIATCEEELRAAAEHFGDGPQIALAILHTKLLQGELSVIRKNIAFLQSSAHPNINDIASFEEKYRGQVADRHGYIVPPNVDQALKVPIDTLFVEPRLSPLKRGSEHEQIELRHLLRGLHRGVVLGQPGGGKSTSAHKICHDLASDYAGRLCCERRLTPVLVVLKDYAADKNQHHSSILQFIERTAASKYQLEPPPSAFAYLLLNGRAMVIFDGLDELLDTHDRREITSDVESFCNAYPSVPVLVTSREVGYDQAPLRTRVFDAYRLAPFDRSQITSYVGKWFRADDTLDVAEQKQKIDGFIRESQFASDLASNPLMLSLMCRIYRGENYIPQNRPDVYEKCARMLFDQWDKGRGIRVSGAVESIASQIHPAIMYLAHWVYENEDLQSGVTEKDLTAKMIAYLFPRRFDDEEQAAAVALEFVAFLRGRAWVLSESGTTSAGDPLWSFTHRTFLEYFAANQLVRLNPVPEKLAEVLLPHIAKEEWDVVAQLAMQILQRTAQDGGDRLLQIILDRQRGTPTGKRFPYLSFTARALGFTFPPPVLVRDIARDALYWSRDQGVRGIKTPTRKRGASGRMISAQADKPSALVAMLISCTPANATAVSQVFEAFVVDSVTNGTVLQTVAAIDMAVHSWWGVHRVASYTGGAFDVASWNDAATTWLRPLAARVRERAAAAPWMLNELFLRGLLTWTEYLHDRGLRGFFTHNAPFPVSKPMLGLSAAESTLHAAAGGTMEEDPKRETRLQQLAAIGATLSDSQPPWAYHAWAAVDSESVTGGSFRRTEDRWEELKKLDGNALFAVLGLFCAHIDSNVARNPEMAWRSQTQEDDVFLCLFRARVDPSSARRVQARLRDSALTAGQLATLVEWLEGRIVFTRLRASSKPTQSIIDSGGST